MDVLHIVIYVATHNDYMHVAIAVYKSATLIQSAACFLFFSRQYTIPLGAC